MKFPPTPSLIQVGTDNHIPAGIQPFLPSFLQRDGWLFQVQARMVERKSRETRGSRMASTSIVPARTANRRQHNGGRRAEGKEVHE